MDKCPQEYRENCERYPAKCPVCAAGYGSRVMHYQPKEDSLPEHPHAQVLKDSQKRGSLARSKGHRDEKRALANLATKLVKGTIGSGAVCGDGDATLLGVGQIETKSRPNIGITHSEYQKGVKQGIKAWQIVTPHGTFYVLEEATFVNLTQNFLNA